MSKREEIFIARAQIRFAVLRVIEATENKRLFAQKVRGLLPDFQKKYWELVRGQRDGVLTNSEVTQAWKDHVDDIRKENGPEVLAALNEALGIGGG